MQRLVAYPLLVLLVLLSACTPPAKNASASVAITSPTDGAIITGSRNITVTADLTDATADAVITAELNGDPVTATRSGDVVSVAVVLADGANAVLITVANSGQKLPGRAALNLDYRPAPVPVVAGVVITSHVDGATVTGSRNITVTADLTDAAADAVIIAELNGDPVTATRSGDVVSVTIPLADHANTVVITVANPDQATPASDTLNLNYPFLTLSTGQAASLVIGQPDFVTTDEAAPEKLFEGPYGRPLLAGGILYLPDYGANRVLGYDGVPTANGAAADFVLGQANFDDDESTRSASVFPGPQTLDSDGERLFVADYSADRILVYNSLPTVTGAAADHVIGQADFASSDSDCSATRFSDLESVRMIDGKLIVADGGNNRVLIWNAVPTVVDTPADLVLGQNSMTTCEENDDDQDGIEGTAPTNRTMYWPADVWSDGERLIVADTGNNRVLIWNAFPTTSFAPADLVLGQADFTTDGWGTGPDSLDMPYMLHSNGNQLFVADSDNNRVLIWNEFPTDSGQEADVVLGQTDMTGNDSNAGGSVSSMGFDYPTGVYVHGDQLFVADNGNDRYLVFEGANP